MRNKGQAMIGLVFIYGLILLMGFGLMGLTSVEQGQIQRTITQQIDYRISDIQRRSVVTITMADKMWRSGIKKGKYDDRSAYKIISYYFSTPGNAVYVDGKKIPMTQVRNDIKKYLRYKMDRYLKKNTPGAFYKVVIRRRSVSNQANPRKIEVGKYPATGEFSKIEYPITLANGEEAVFTLYTKTSTIVTSLRGS